jgi:predicted CXXCH cytochrome family protein
MRQAILLVCGLALVAALSAKTPDFVRENVPDFTAEGYTGHEACRSCHVELYDRWAKSAHAHSTSPLTPENAPPEMLEGGRVEHAPGQSDFSREDDGFFVTTLGDDGLPHRYPVTHVVGPKRVSFFLTRLPDGGLQVLPSMREVTTGAWFDYTHLIFGVPGTDYATPPIIRPGEPSYWTGPLRSYDRTCGRCHSSGRREATPAADGGTRMEWDPLPVDCEACHGPGAAHVAFWKNPPETWRPDPILALGKLPRDRAQDVCLWCHLESEVISEHWRPGDDVFEFLSPTLLDNLERVDAAGRPVELVYDGLPFLFSACAEKGKLNCVYCHDAHGTHHTADLLVPPDRTDTLCAGCHFEIAANSKTHTHHKATGTGGACVACHMPYLAIERGHGVVRDHTLGSPLPDLYGGRTALDACKWCHTRARGAPADAPLIPEEEVLAACRAWYPGAKLRPEWVRAMAGGRDRHASAFDPLVRAARFRANPRLVRASAAKLLGPYGDRALVFLMDLATDDDSLVRRSAVEALGNSRHPDADLVLRNALSDPSIAVRFSAARTALAGWERVRGNPDLLAAVIPVLEEDAAAMPQDDSRWFRLGAAYALSGDDRGALRAYGRKLEIDPYAVHVRRAVEEIRARLGD